MDLEGWTNAEAWTCCTARHLTGTGAQQGYMLAQIAEEIHAPDRAARNTGEGGNSDYQDLGLEVDDADPTDTSSSIPLSCSRTGVRVLEGLTR